jgi:hypothetical protein
LRSDLPASKGGGTPPSARQELTLLSRLVLGLILVFIVGGILWNGISAGVFERMGRDLMSRPGSAMSFRLALLHLDVGTP